MTTVIKDDVLGYDTICKVSAAEKPHDVLYSLEMSLRIKYTKLTKVSVTSELYTLPLYTLPIKLFPFSSFFDLY